MQAIRRTAIRRATFPDRRVEYEKLYPKLTPEQTASMPKHDLSKSTVNCGGLTGAGQETGKMMYSFPVICIASIVFWANACPDHVIAKFSCNA